MTLYLDPATIFITLASSAISIAISVLATWYFSKRHYSRATRPQPVTENDIKMRDYDNGFRIALVCVVGAVIVITMLIFSREPPDVSNQQTMPTPTTNQQEDLLTPDLTDPLSHP